MKFNFNRLINLVRRDLIIYKNYLLFGIAGLFIFLFGLSQLVAYNDNQPVLDPDFWYGWWVALFVGGGLVFTALVFWEFKSHAGRIQFLSLPASNLEKTISRLFYSAIAYPVVITAIIALAYLLTSSFLGFSDWGSYGDEELSIPLHIFYLGNAFIYIWAIAFNRFVIPKTIIFSFLAFMAFAFMASLGFRIIFHEHFEGLTIMNHSFQVTNGSEIEMNIGRWLKPVLLYCIPVFFWVVAYFKMKEKEA